MPDDVRQILLEAIEDSLYAQLIAVRRLRKGGDRAGGAEVPRVRRHASQVSMAFDILQAAGRPLHISEIIKAAEKRFHFKLDRESLVSALTKRLARDERFARTAPNTFSVRRPPQGPGKEE
jgi:N-acetylglucosamine kinase-like BadF-type ATPase